MSPDDTVAMIARCARHQQEQPPEWGMFQPDRPGGEGPMTSPDDDGGARGMLQPDAQLGVRVFRWDGRRLTVDGASWVCEVPGADQLADLLIQAAIGVRVPADTSQAFAREVLAVLTPPWTMLSDAVSRWVETHHGRPGA